MPIEEHERSVLQLASQHSIGDSDFGKDALECVGLCLGMHPPVLWIGA